MKKYRFQQASPQELSLYCIIGEAVCAVQHVEDALSHSIVIKGTKTRLRSEADNHLKKYHKYTLGTAIKVAKQKSLYPQSLLIELREFLEERNWLIHKSITEARKKWDDNIFRDELLSRIKDITTQAHFLQQLIEEDLIAFAENEGVDMTHVKDEIEKYYS